MVHPIIIVIITTQNIDSPTLRHTLTESPIQPSSHLRIQGAGSGGGNLSPLVLASGNHQLGPRMEGFGVAASGVLVLVRV